MKYWVLEEQTHCSLGSDQPLFTMVKSIAIDSIDQLNNLETNL